MRAVEQAVGKRILLGGTSMPQGAGSNLVTASISTIAGSSPPDST